MNEQNSPIEVCPVHGEMQQNDGHLVLVFRRNATSYPLKESKRFCGECWVEFVSEHIPELIPLDVYYARKPRDLKAEPALFYWLAQGTWSTRATASFIFVRIYWKSRWTPLVKVLRRSTK